LFKYHRNNLRKFTSKHPSNTKKIISDLIRKKVDILNDKTTCINPLHIPLIKGVNYSQQLRHCKVTGLNISMQKEDSSLLSHTGLKYYFNTNKKVYYQIRERYLTALWLDADYQTQIKEIAHNIRNNLKSMRITQKRLYPPQQLQMFDRQVL